MFLRNFFVIIAIIFTINIGVGTCFVYYMNRDKKLLLDLNMSIMQKVINIMGNIKQINIKNRTYYFLNDMINIEDFDFWLVTIRTNSDKKLYKNIGV